MGIRENIPLHETKAMQIIDTILKVNRKDKLTVGPNDNQQLYWDSLGDTIYWQGLSLSALLILHMIADRGIFL